MLSRRLPMATCGLIAAMAASIALGSTSALAQIGQCYRVRADTPVYLCNPESLSCTFAGGWVADFGSRFTVREEGVHFWYVRNDRHGQWGWIYSSHLEIHFGAC